MKNIILFIAFCMFISACGASGDSDRADPFPDKESGDATGKPSTNIPGDPVLTLNNSQISDNKKFRALFEWRVGPLQGNSSGILSISNLSGHLLADIGEVLVKPWMKIHGHGTGNWHPKVASLGNGYQWEVTDIYFIMAGPWELNVRIKTKDFEDTMEVQVEVP